MSREILFRGKGLDNGKWVEGYYVICRGHHYIIPLSGVGYPFSTDEVYRMD